MRRIHLRWEKCPDGYEVVTIEPSAVEWNREQKGHKVLPSASATPLVARAIKKFGVNLFTEAGPIRAVEIIEPVNESLVLVEPFKRAKQSHYLRFAQLKTTLEMCEFASDVGLVDRRGTSPSFVRWWQRHINLMLEAVTEFDRLKRRKGRFVSFLDDHLLKVGFSRFVEPFLGTNDSGAPLVRLEPVDLVAGLWLQFLFGVEGDVEFKKCKVCRGFLELGRDGLRSDAQYCSAACKQRAYRNSKRQAT